MMNENMMNENRKSNGVNLQEVFNSVLIFFILHSFFNFPRIFHLYLNTVMKFLKKHTNNHKNQALVYTECGQHRYKAHNIHNILGS